MTRVRAWLRSLFIAEPSPLDERRPWVVWYRSTYGTPEYIGHDEEGYPISVRHVDQAKRFDTEEAARKAMPVYDGSAGIADRTGVCRVMR